MANIQINENDIKQMVTEVIRKIMSGGNHKSIYDITFVSYGTNEFSKEKFKAPFMRNDINKPQHGFWGSPIDSLNGWGEWCDSENFHTDRLDKHVLFKIKKGANIYIIDTQKDLDYISKDEDIEDMIQSIQRRFNCSYEEAKNAALIYHHKNLKKIIDFNFLYKYYDGIFVTERAVNKLRQVNDGDGLYWWDVESICVFNPNVIEIIKENAFDRAKVPSYINDDYLENDDYYGFDDEEKVTNKMRQINKSYELYGNRNIDSDSSHLFNGEHPGILAQGHGNNKNTKLARKYNGTIKSGL